MTGWTTGDMPDQRGRTVLITGANSGLGLRSAQALAGAGARVLMACRDLSKAAEARDVVKAAATGPEPETVSLDLSDLDSVSEAAATVAARVEALDVLMNNAGVMAIPLRRNELGHEMQFATNHLGHFALTGRLLPVLLAAPAPRVVTTTSQAHRVGRMRWDDLQWDHGYRKWLAYGQSKLANLLFAFELGRRAQVAHTELVSAAAHPGYASTHLQAAGPEMAGNAVAQRTMALANRIFAQSDDMGALPQLYAATMADVHSGDYFGPDGLFEQRGHPKHTEPSKAARDQVSARRLWERSEQLTGVRHEWPA